MFIPSSRNALRPHLRLYGFLSDLHIFILSSDSPHNILSSKNQFTSFESPHLCTKKPLSLPTELSPNFSPISSVFKSFHFSLSFSHLDTPTLSPPPLDPSFLSILL